MNSPPTPAELGSLIEFSVDAVMLVDAGGGEDCARAVLLDMPPDDLRGDRLG